MTAHGCRRQTATKGWMGMALMAAAFPVLPDQMDAWRQFIADLNGPRKADFQASRTRAGVHERAFAQQTPQGMLVIVTLEAERPDEAMAAMLGASDPFSRWFM